MGARTDWLTDGRTNGQAQGGATFPSHAESPLDDLAGALAAAARYCPRLGCVARPDGGRRYGTTVRAGLHLAVFLGFAAATRAMACWRRLASKKVGLRLQYFSEPIFSAEM